MKKLKSIQDFSEALRSYRKAQGITQDELAKMANLSRKVIIDLEKGKSTIQFYVLENILKVTDLSLWIKGIDE
jgi:transcriptional regulator with XRE-family HTH domain